MNFDEDSYILLSKSFTDRVKELKALILLRSSDNGLSEQWDDQLVKIAKRVTQIEQTMALMKQQVQSERSYIQAAHDLKLKVQSQNEYLLNYVERNLPPHLPGSAFTTTNFEMLPPSSVAAGQRNQPQALQNVTNQLNISQEGVPVAAPPKPKTTRVEKLSYITKDELDSIDKYIKGRVTLEKVNKAIDELNSVIEAKYKILKTPMIKLSGEALKKFKAYKDQETKETKSHYFFTDDELKTTVAIKLDATGRAILGILRQSNRIKDYGGTLKRYVVVS